MVVVVAGIASTWVLSWSPKLARRATVVQIVAGLVMVGNEAARTEPTGYVGVWVLILGTTIMNFSICRRAERQHRRNVMEALSVLGDLERMHRERARMMADHALLRRGGGASDHH